MDFARFPRKLQKSCAHCCGGPLSILHRVGQERPPASAAPPCAPRDGVIWEEGIYWINSGSRPKMGRFWCQGAAACRGRAGCRHVSETGGEEHKWFCMICKHRRGDCNGFITSNNYSRRRGCGYGVLSPLWGKAEPLLAISLC